MNKNKNKKKTTKRVEKVDVDDDVVLEEKEYLFQPLRYLPQPLQRRGAQIACKLGIPPDIATDNPSNTGTKAACLLDTSHCIHGESRRCITSAMPTRSVSLPLGGSG